MADLATWWHWSASEMRAETLESLIDWHERLIERLPKPKD